MSRGRNQKSQMNPTLPEIPVSSADRDFHLTTTFSINLLQHRSLLTLRRSGHVVIDGEHQLEFTETVK